MNVERIVETGATAARGRLHAVAAWWTGRSTRTSAPTLVPRPRIDDDIYELAIRPEPAGW